MIGDGGHAKVIKDINPDAYVIAIGNNRIRKKVALEHGNERFDIVIHPTAWVSPRARIGEGTVVMAHAVIQAGAIVGMHCIVNSGATLDHDCKVSDFAHIAPGAHLCGGVKVGEGALVGVGEGVMPGAVIPAWTIFPFGREND